jgi:hypothetical protein
MVTRPILLRTLASPSGPTARTGDTPAVQQVDLRYYQEIAPQIAMDRA